MHILSENYTLADIKNMAFDKVPRGTFVSPRSKIALDYHQDLCSLKLNDNTQINVYLSERPVVNRNIYLMRGIVYKIEESRYEASFGGLLMFYEGPLHESLCIEAEIYISVAKV